METVELDTQEVRHRNEVFSNFCTRVNNSLSGMYTKVCITSDTKELTINLHYKEQNLGKIIIGLFDLESLLKNKDKNPYTLDNYYKIFNSDNFAGEGYRKDSYLRNLELYNGLALLLSTVMHIKDLSLDDVREIDDNLYRNYEKLYKLCCGKVNRGYSNAGKINLVKYHEYRAGKNKKDK